MNGWCVCVGGLPSLPLSFIILRREHTVVLTHIPEHIVHCRGEKGGSKCKCYSVMHSTGCEKEVGYSSSKAKILSLSAGDGIAVMAAGQ